MLTVQQNFYEYISKINNQIILSELPMDIKDNLVNSTLESTIKNAELIVPVIGPFSSGKSTLINSLLEKKYLSEGLTPETALATEVRYSNKETIHAVKKNSEYDEFSISQIKKISEKAKNYKYQRVFLNNKKIKEIEPLILVDMPGFDSSLELHQQSILEYLDRGSHYIVLINAENGIITRSMETHLLNIQNYDRDFSFFISRTNLKPETEIKEIKTQIEEQIEEKFDLSKKVSTLGLNSGENLYKVLCEIDAENLFKNLFITEIKENLLRIEEIINTNIVALKKDYNTNTQAIEEINLEIKGLKKQQDSMTKEAKNKYSDVSTNIIIENIGKELSCSVDELAKTFINDGQDSFSKLIEEIVRFSLIENVKISITDIGENIINDFSLGLENINSTISSFSINEDWLFQLTENTKNILKKTQDLFDQSSFNSNKKTSGKLYQIVSTVLSISTNVIKPLLELVIIFLPDILSDLFLKYRQQNQREEIKAMILTMVIPKLKRHLKVKLPAIFEEQITALINQISLEFQQNLAEKQKIIESMENFKKDKISDTKKLIKNFEVLNQSIHNLSNNPILSESFKEA